ncbi:MAG: ParA family protein [Xenococcaceae cyanobacterium]
MGYVISMVNMKGGVGKTTVTVNLATCLAKNYGKRVLVVDLDTQINATLSLMSPFNFAKLKQDHRTLRALINQATQPDNPSRHSIQEIIQHNICQVKGLDLMPGDIELYQDFFLAEIIFSKSRGEQEDFEQNWNRMEDALIRGILQPIVNEYDWILLDFSPGDHLITRSGILASDFYVIPAKPEPLSLVGIGILEGRIKQLKESDRSDINLIGIIFTSLGRATNMAENVRNRLSEDFGKNSIFNTEIPMNVAVARAVDEFKPVVLTEPQSPGAKAFNTFSQEFLERFALKNKKN